MPFYELSSYVEERIFDTDSLKSTISLLSRIINSQALLEEILLHLSALEKLTTDLEESKIENADFELQQQNHVLFVKNLLSNELKEEDLIRDWELVLPIGPPSEALDNGAISDSPDEVEMREQAGPESPGSWAETREEPVLEDVLVPDIGAFTFEILKKRLRQLAIDADAGLRLPMSILLELMQEGSLRNDLLHQIGQERHLEKSRSETDESSYLVQRNKILRFLIDFIEVYITEADLLTDWERNPAIDRLVDTDSIVSVEVDDSEGLETDPQNEIYLPDNEIKPLKGPESDRKNKYKRLLANARNSIIQRKYLKAYELCQEAYSEIETDSAQLCELLLISCYKKEGNANIIRNTLMGQSETLDELRTYVDEFNRWQKKGNCPTSTGEKNVQKIYRNLLYELRRVYFSKKKPDGKTFNYLFDRESAAIRSEIRAIINLAWQLYAVQPSRVFYPEMMNELFGGGRLEWLKVDDKSSSGFSETDPRLPVMKKMTWLRKELPKMMSEEENLGDLNLRIANTLFNHLNDRKYERIQMELDPKKRIMRWTDARRESVVKVMRAFKVGYLLTGDKRFLEVPIAELQGEGKMDWLDLDDSGNLISSYRSEKIKFDALAELNWLFAHAYGEEKASKMETAKVVHIARNNAEFADKQYRKLSMKNPPSLRQDLADLLIDWKKCFMATADPEYLKNFIAEIMGDGLTDWFELGADEALASHLVVGNFKGKFDPELEAIWLLENLPDLAGARTLEELKVRHVFNRLKSKWEKLPDEISENRVDTLRDAANLLRQAANCFRLFPDATFLQFCMDALRFGYKFQWIIQLYLYNRFEYFNSLGCNRIGFNAQAALREWGGWLPSSSTEIIESQHGETHS